MPLATTTITSTEGGHGDLVVEAAACMEEQDDQDEHAEVDMRLHPLLERAECGAIPAFANPEKCQEQDQRRSGDSSIRIDPNMSEVAPCVGSSTAARRSGQ